MSQSGNPPEELRKWSMKIQTLRVMLNDFAEFALGYSAEVSNLAQVRVRLDEIAEFSERFEEYQTQVELLQNCPDEEWIKVRREFRNQLCDTKASLFKVLDEHDIKTKDNSSSPSFSSVTQQQQCNSFSGMKYPPCSLPTFDGDWQQWSSFIDLFNSMFHNEHSNLPLVQRFHYLKSCLKDQASDVIKSIPTTAENFQRAYDLLVSRYENKGAIIQSHIRALLDTPKVTTPSSSELQNLHHHITSNINALRSLQQPIEQWDAWLVTLLCSRMDSSTVGEWYLQYKKKDLPSYSAVEEFLINRITAYEAGDINSCVHDTNKASFKVSSGRYHNKKVLFAKPNDKRPVQCPACTAQHKVYSCEKFKLMSVADRKALVMKARLCFNCLNYGHQVVNCCFPPCPNCGQRHNSKLHEDEPREKTSIYTANSETTLSSDATAMCTGVDNPAASNLNVLLATASVDICDKFGRMHKCRAVLDSGSQLNFVTRSCATKLKLDTTIKTLNIVGVSSMTSSTKELEETTLSSRFGDYKIKIKLHSLPAIVNSLPSQLVCRTPLRIPQNMVNALADPQFDVPGPIDVLLGADIFFKIFSGEKLQLSEHAALNYTKLGWIVTGKVPVVSGSANATLIVSEGSALSFFVSKSNQRSLEERRAEEHFQATFHRNIDGRFVVKLPLVHSANVLGSSLFMAQKRFYNLERRLANDSSLAKQYDNFIQEYLLLGHMELSTPVFDKPVYYLPHHPVFKVDSTTTKLRVVFDGSAESSSGLSLNDIMLRGPKIQPDIFNILLRFRLHRVALTADVEKMYRQVLVDADDCYLQRIVYRSHPSEPLKHFNLKTVTYGTKSASFLATRCLSELGYQNSETAIGQVICHDFYVDDLISGGDTEHECYTIHEQLQSILGSAGFPLRKWCSNSTSLMAQITADHTDPTFLVHIKNDETVSTLGLAWQPAQDSFCFRLKSWSPPIRMTKRTLLSDINSVYDPLGFISPVLVRGKIFLQQLWAMKLGWDDELPVELQIRWTKFIKELHMLHSLQIPRRVVYNDNLKIAIHGFSDASQEAFGACVYIQSASCDSNLNVHLFASKSRVAPTRASTIPRLELCGALLLAELVDEAIKELKLLNIRVPSEDITLWSDSTIVLAWISTRSPLQVYVANRVAKILDVTASSQWRHVPTADNPADHISRGIPPSSISQLKNWWHGPKWLSQSKENWPLNPYLPEDIPETRPIKLALVTTNNGDSHWILKNYSSWFTLLRITALVRRFIFNCKVKVANLKNSKTGFLLLQELDQAQHFWISNAQFHYFADEIHNLKNNQSVKRHSCLKSLSPFIDAHGLIRVGGRLQNAPISDIARHPVVLPSKSLVTKLIFQYEHKRLLHIGPQALLAHLSSKFWPIRGRLIARQTVQKCIQCFRASPRFVSPYMAPLPRVRVTIDRPFAKTGVDYCGPVMVRSGRRGATPTKSYVCVFVCMVTRAVHLELVSSLSSEDFLATLSRFMARRGQVSDLFSDNGTNFIGANRILKAHFKEFKNTKVVNDYFIVRTISWHFIPPSAPHFGGLWEAAVQSAKRHLLRITKAVMFTYDETTTLLCRVEAALNSRPMTQISSDPADYSPLTPGHFLIGGPLMLPPEPTVANVPQNRLKRFKLMQSNMQIFWNRWSTEYLPQVQRRGKWTRLTRNPNIGDLAILKDDILPPMHWKTVRVIHLHPGLDGVVRVVTLRNSSGLEFKRPVVKIALLPTEDDETSAVTSIND